MLYRNIDIVVLPPVSTLMPLFGRSHNPISSERLDLLNGLSSLSIESARARGNFLSWAAKNTSFVSFYLYGTLRFLIGSEVATLKSPIFVRKSNFKKRDGDISRLCFLYWQERKSNIYWQERKIGCYYPEKHSINILIAMANSEHLCFLGGDCCVFVSVK